MKHFLQQVFFNKAIFIAIYFRGMFFWIDFCLTLFKMGQRGCVWGGREGGRGCWGGGRRPLASFFSVSFPKIGISSQDFLTYSFNIFVTLKFQGHITNPELLSLNHPSKNWLLCSNAYNATIIYKKSHSKLSKKWNWKYPIN